MTRFDVAVCAKAEVAVKAARWGATHLVSILDPGESVTRPDGVAPRHHLRVRFADEEDPLTPGAPTRADVQEILDFARDLPEDARLLVHCTGGKCRSTAAALAILVQAGGGGRDAVPEAVRDLVAIRPEAIPNLLVARHADEILGAGGEIARQADLIAERSAARIIAGESR